MYIFCVKFKLISTTLHKQNKNKKKNVADEQEQEQEQEEEEEEEDELSTDYDKRCAFCSKEDPEHRCSACKSIAYCSQNCQLQDWKR